MNARRLTAISCFLIAGMGASAAAAPAEVDLDAIYRHPEALAYYAEKPDFFTFSSPDKLPGDLEWHDGLEQKPFASPHARQGGTAHGWISSWPPTLRVVGPNANSGFRSLQYDHNEISMVETHPNTRKHIPGLAREWAVSEDKRTAYFRLDPDARFTDGQPVSVDDYFFTFFYMHSKYIVAPWYNDWYTREYVNITKYDDYTMSITIPTAKPDPIYYTTIRPTPRNFYREFGPDFVQRYQWIFEPKTGAYTIRPEDIKKGESIALTRVENWWANDKKFLRGRYNPTRREYRVIRDPNKAFEVFKKGDLDMYGMSLPKYWYDKTDAPVFRNGYVHKVVFYNERPRPTYGFYINSAMPLLNNRDIRVGLHHACDWQRVIDGYFRGDYERLQTYNEGYGRYTHPGIRARRFDPRKAAQAFRRAGFSRRGGDGIFLDERGRRLSFRLTMTDSDFKRFLPTLIDSARDAGVEIVPEVLDNTTSYRKVMEKNHEICFWAWAVGGTYPRYWEGWHKVNAYKAPGIRKRQTNNITCTADDEKSELIDRFRRLDNEDDIERLSHVLLQWIHDDAAFIPGFVRPWYRQANWRWVRFPEGFDVKDSEGPGQYMLYWIDEDIKKETLEAMTAGTTFEPVSAVYDQYRRD